MLGKRLLLFLDLAHKLIVAAAVSLLELIEVQHHAHDHPPLLFKLCRVYDHLKVNYHMLAYEGHRLVEHQVRIEDLEGLIESVEAVGYYA